MTLNGLMALILRFTEIVYDVVVNNYFGFKIYF